MSMQEGQIVGYGQDTYRVRRDHGETLELVNHTGYYEAEASQVSVVCKEDGTPLTTDDGDQNYYCGLCGRMREIEHFPH